MCGICGIVYRNPDRPVNRDLVEKMTGALRHRGPDSEGYFLENNVGLGMRRLKVIDLATGGQPVFNEDRSVAVILNGEIYNYVELRESLVARGHRFRSESDTEVIVHLYEDHGEACLSYLNGMFGIAIWDCGRNKLMLARDRLGEKPLYYKLDDNGIGFASELKSFLVEDGFDRALDPAALYHYFSLISVPAPHSIFKSVQKLPAGHYLTYQDGQATLSRYWNISYQPSKGLSEADYCEQLRELMIRSLKQRVRSDVPFGAFLSGGIDSSVVVALMSEIIDEPVKTFSIGFEEDGYNELDYARKIAQQYQTDHHELVVRPSAIGLLDKLIWHFDEPFAGPSAIPTYLVSELARQHVTVVLTGDGGDEVFLGYDRYIRMLKRRKFSALPGPLRRFLGQTVGSRLPHGAYGKMFLQTLPENELHYYNLGLSEQWKQSLFSQDFLVSLGGLDTFDIMEDFTLGEETDYLNKLNYFDFMFYLPDNVLVKVDRMAMANSLETRCLFLDHEIVEFAAQIPVELKINGIISKYILKKSMQDKLPDEIINRGKWGFALPVDVWFRKELKEMIIEKVEASRSDGMFNHAYLSMILSEHLSGRRNHQRVLWAYLIYQLWQEKFLHQPTGTELSNKVVSDL